jgi:hypothetical protein
MVTSHLQGGLGNQMFQIAAAHNLALKLNVESKFDFDASFVSTQGNNAKKYKDNLFKNINNGDIDFTNFKVYREPSFAYNEIPLVDNLVLLGNFQSEKYLPNKTELNKLFDFDTQIISETNQFISEMVGDNNLTAIHVRRGDYLLKPNFHPVLSMDYYNKAIEIIGGDKFILISDDMDWCRQNFIGEKFIYSPFTSEINDLHLFINADNHIIANSSFSWWGAYLCEKNNKVIAPKIWFGQDGPQDTQDIYLKNFTLC